MEYKPIRKVVSGNYAAAYAALHARVQVVAAYPITPPQTSIIEKIAEFIANGEADIQYVPVESEHSAMAACIGASAAGARAFTATSAQGLALMHEMLHWASGARLPIVMVDVNRAMAPRGAFGTIRPIHSRREIPAGCSSTPRTTRRFTMASLWPSRWPRR